MAYDGMHNAMTNEANKQTGVLHRFAMIGAIIVAACLTTGATFLGYGVDANLPWPVTSNTTIAPKYCQGTVLVGTGSTGQFTLTLPAVTGFPPNCSVLIKNGDTTNGKILSGFPSDLNSILWPQQSVGVKIVNGAWQTFNNPGRWNLTWQPTIYVNGMGAPATCGYTGASTCATGNNANDGLTPATPLATMQQGITNLFSYIAPNGNKPIFNLAHGSSTNYAFQCIQGPLLGEISFAVTGDNNAPTAVKIAGTISVKDQCFPTLRSLEIDGGASTAIVCDFYGGVDLRSVTFGATRGRAVSANHGCPVNFLGQDGSAPTNSLQIGTSADSAFGVFNGGSVNIGAPINIPNHITVATAFAVLQGGYITGVNGSAFTGAGVVTGPKCNIADTSSSFDGNPNTYLPGTSNCTYPFLPNPSTSTLGGIESIVTTAHQWIDSISTAGAPHQSQPAFSDLSGTPTTLGGYGITNARALLLSPTFFVNSSASANASCNGGTNNCAPGDDTKNCLSAANACKTAQRVLGLINSQYDAGNTAFAVALADTVASSDPTNYKASCVNGPALGTSSVALVGNLSDNTKVKVQMPDGGTSGIVANGCTLTYANVHFIDSPSNTGAGFVIAGGGHGFAHVDLVNDVFDALANGAAIDAESGSSISVLGCSIVGNIKDPILARGGGVVDFNNVSCPVSNNLTFNTFATANSGGIIRGVGTSTFGSPTGITGSRCNITGYQPSDSATNLNTLFPGSTDCVIAVVSGSIGLQTGSGGSSSLDYGTNHWPMVSGGGSNVPNRYEQVQNSGIANPSIVVGNANCTLGSSCNPSSRQLIAGGTANAVAAGVTDYFCTFNPNGAQTVACTASFSGTFKNLYVNGGNAPGAALNYTITLYVGAYNAMSATALTCKITGASATSCNDTTHAVTIAAGQAFAFQVVADAGTATLSGVSFGVEFDNP
jgi:hypothetical protein